MPSSAWALSLARISQQIIFRLQASSREQHCHPGFRPADTRHSSEIAVWHLGFSGDIVVMNKPNWYLFAKPSTYASTHGSPWSYDTNVPLAMYGSNWIKPGKYGDSEVVDLARTIAFILNVRPPNGCEGRVLSEAMN
jgi:hypothetical protein